MTAQMDGITQPGEQNTNQFGGCTGIVATLNLNVDNLTNVGNGDVIVQITELQGGALVESVAMSNTATMDYPICVEPGCYRAKIVANGANVGFVCTLTVEGNDYIMTYNTQNISFGTDLCITGCMQFDACNYNPDANISDYASCVFQEAGFDCDGNCLTSPIDESTLATLSPFEFSEADCATYDGIGSPLNLTAFANDGNYNIVTDNNGVYENTGQSGAYSVYNGCLVNYNGTQYTFDATTNRLESIEQDDYYYYYYYGSTCYVGLSLASAAGCTDPTACNYDAAASSDDGSCEFVSCAGCTNATACNYDASATIDDGSCDFASCFGCTDVTACNYDAAASSDDGSCEFLSCSCGTAIYDMLVEQGCLDLEAASQASGGFDFGCQYPSDFNIAWNGSTDTGYLIPSFGAMAAYVDVPFCDITYADAISANYVEDYGLADVHGFIPNNTFIVYTQDGNYYAIGDIQVVDIQPTAITIDFAIRLIEGTVGCMFELACNYDATATIMDYTTCDFESCVGCTYPDAENYNDMASIDDGSCTYGECVTCMGDFNNDGSINSGDLLVFLGVFGGTCEQN